MSEVRERPKRIQRKRTKGWKMPESAMYVGRPTKYGNPYSVSIFGLELALKLFRDTAYGFWTPSNVSDLPDETAKLAYELHRDWRKKFSHHPVDIIHLELGNADLACWCKLGEPCHADVLLEIANS